MLTKQTLIGCRSRRVPPNHRTTYLEVWSENGLFSRRRGSNQKPCAVALWDVLDPACRSLVCEVLAFSHQRLLFLKSGKGMLTLLQHASQRPATP